MRLGLVGVMRWHQATRSPECSAEEGFAITSIRRMKNESTSIPATRADGAAYLSHRGGFTSFSFGGDVIRFATSQCLRRYIQVKKWEAGYIEVDADYGNGVEEDYIDLLPILKNLYYDADEFLKPIRKVEVRYE